MKKKSKRTLLLIRHQKNLETRLKTDGIYSINDYIEARLSRIHGRGIFASKQISKGTYIIEYIGEKISKSEANLRAKMSHSVYIFDLNSRVDIDGATGGNGAHLINHSCEPNAEAEWVNNHIYIIAKKLIHPGEEILYNYGFDEVDYEYYPCQCGASKCRGFMLSDEAWKKINSNGINM